MSAVEDFLNSLSEEDRKLVEDAKNTPPAEQSKSPEELVFETYTHILDMGVTGGQISEAERNKILSEFRRGS